MTVDPSFTTYSNGDTWVQNADYTSSQGSSPELRAGTYDGGAHKARSFMHFDNGAWDGKHVTAATLEMRNFYSGSCTGAAIRAARIIDAWTNASVSWGTQPAVGTLMDADYSPARGYNASCDTGDAVWNVTGMVDEWAQGKFTNNGIRLKAVDETSIYTWRKYRSANYTANSSFKPKLNVTYNSFPNKAGTPSVTPGNAGYSTSTTPTLKATVSDADGGSVRGKFEVLQGTTEKWSGTSAYVSSGSTASKQVGSRNLVDGTTYTVRVKGNDGTDDSKPYSTSTTFKVDVTKPTATVSASAFTNGQWTTTVPSANSFTFNGPADTKSFAYTLDGVSKSPLTADVNGNATLSWLPKSGSHTLTVTPTDKAGNAATTPTTFTFGVGPASFTTPASVPGERYRPR